MVPSVEQPAIKSSLLVIAILAGMATAAGIVALMALHHAALSHSSAANQPAVNSRPSPFGHASNSSPTSDVNLTSAQIAKSGNTAIVTVTGYDDNDQALSQAAGYVYSSSGIIVTSYSAIRGASSVTIDASNGQELNVIALMGYSPSQDLAVLAVLEGSLPALETEANEVVQEGDLSTVMGPNRTGSQGTVGPRRSVGGVDMIPINAQAAPGSPVLNRHGRVVGMIIRRPAGANAAFAIPSHYVSDLLAERRTMSFAQMLEETGHAQSVPPAKPDLVAR